MPSVSFVLFPEFQMLAYVLATETLRVANKCAGRDVFDWHTRSATNAPLQASNGALVAPDILDWSGGPRSDLILLCAGYNPLTHLTPRVRAYAARASSSACVIGGVDTGTVIMAELGLLDGRRAVLHYEAEPAFREIWPEIDVADQIYCLDQNRLTAAGGTATGDAILAWIARDVDAELADQTATGMVHGEVRHSDTPQRKLHTSDPVLMEMHRIMADTIAEPIPIEDICAHLGLSAKQLRLRCQRTYGMTPLAYYQRFRMETAHHLIVNTEQSITEIAQMCGFESLSGFSRAVAVRFGSSPKQLRMRNMRSNG